MNIDARKLCNLKLELAMAKDPAFNPDNYYWVISDDVRKEITLGHGLSYDPFTGDVPKLKVLFGVKVEAYDHRRLGVAELKKKQPSYYITTASRPDDDLVMKMLKDQLNMQYGTQPGRGGFVYSNPKIVIDDLVPTDLCPATMSPLNVGNSTFRVLDKLDHEFYHNKNWREALEVFMDKHDRIKKPEIDRVIYNNPATIVFWKDGTKTVVKAQDEAFDEEKGLAMAIAKKVYGNNGRYFDKLKKHLPKIEKKPVKKPKARKKSNKK